MDISTPLNKVYTTPFSFASTLGPLTTTDQGIFINASLRYSDFIVNEVDQENKTVRLTSYDLPVPDPEGIRQREEQLQAKEDAEQANREMGDEAKLAELAAVLDNDEETMTQIKKMIDSYGNDVEFVNLKVGNLSSCDLDALL